MHIFRGNTASPQTIDLETNQSRNAIPHVPARPTLRSQSEARRVSTRIHPAKTHARGGRNLVPGDSSRPAAAWAETKRTSTRGSQGNHGTSTSRNGRTTTVRSSSGPATRLKRFLRAMGVISMRIGNRPDLEKGGEDAGQPMTRCDGRLYCEE
jgi:hypothetical protein